METKDGFIPYEATKPAAAHAGTDSQDWLGWRGDGRGGHVPQLPARLPDQPHVLWQRPAMNGGLGRPTVTQRMNGTSSAA